MNGHAEAARALQPEAARNHNNVQHDAQDEAEQQDNAEQRQRHDHHCVATVRSHAGRRSKREHEGKHMRHGAAHCRASRSREGHLGKPPSTHSRPLGGSHSAEPHTPTQRRYREHTLSYSSLQVFLLVAVTPRQQAPGQDKMSVTRCNGAPRKLSATTRHPIRTRMPPTHWHSKLALQSSKLAKEGAEWRCATPESDAEAKRAG